MNFKKIFALAGSALMAIGVVSCGPKDPPTPVIIDPYEDESKLIDLSVRDVTSENGVVAAANPYAAHAGLKVLMEGGNAFDAAIATSFALGVTEPHCSGIGGGGIMVGYNAKTGEFVSYNFREFIPGAGKPTVYKDAEEMDEGIRAAGVPTIVQSLLEIQKEQGSGKVTRADVLKPSIDICNNGFTVTKELASAISGSPDAWNKTAQTKAIYSDHGLALDEGETMKNPNLGKVYQEIADKGAEGFYKGWVAQAMLDAQTAEENKNAWGNGGLWVQEDLDYAMANYPLRVKPVEGTYKGYDIVSATCPSSGGIIMLESLNMLEYFENHVADYSYDGKQVANMKELGLNSPEYINLLSTVTQLAYGDKQKYIGDNKFTKVPISGLINKEYAADRFKKYYTPGKAYNGKYTQKDGQNYGSNVWDFVTDEADRSLLPMASNDEEGQEHYSTTSFSCADKDGNIVSVTQTINHFFGAKIMPEGCGFYLNNQLSSFTLSSSSASYAQPYKNPTSHIMPTIILKDGEPYATLGSPGSMRLVSAVFQTVVNMIDWGMDIQSAIENPRIYSYCVSSSDNGSGSGAGTSKKKALYLEKTGNITQETCDKLADMGYGINTYSSQNLFFGGVQGITFENGKMHGGADIRRDGKALGY